MAPDQSALKAGQGLADARHWTNLGSSSVALWGECRGSGSEPYKVRFETADNGYACTCPSRKQPCKHVLGLLLLAAASPAKLPQAPVPAWVGEWLEKRSARSQPKPAQSAVDPSARQKDAARRAAKREKLAETGIEALDRWLKDLARLGLAFAQTAPPAFWQDQIARMVDCQLPGAARLIKAMQALPGSRSDWAEVLLLRMGRLYLLAQAYRNLAALPEASRQDVRGLLGWTLNQEELLASGSGVQDDWLALASLAELDEKTGLTTQTRWLVGRHSRRIAQVFNFVPRGQPLDLSILPGQVLRGELVYFPGGYPLRAIFKEQRAVNDRFIPAGCPDLDGFFQAYAAALESNPWLETFPAILEGMVPFSAGQSWFVRDARGQALPLAFDFVARWELLALSGGHPLRLFGLWDGFTFQPLAAWEGESFLSLNLNQGTLQAEWS